MRTADLDYDLPASAIAQVPIEPRDAARLLVAVGDGAVEHAHVSDLPDLLGPGDVVVVNDSRVMRARLRLHKPTGGAVEVLLVEERGEWWQALVRPGRRTRTGLQLEVPGGGVVEIGEALEGGTRAVRFRGVSADEVMCRVGEVPLPPYVTEPLADPDRYQTTYAARASSVAAPTAGLHLTPELLSRCRERGAEVHTLELGVGVGTFRPISTPVVDDHRMHAEPYWVPASTLRACEQAERVVAVGTTVVRALEAVAVTGSLEGRTDLFVRPGWRFGAVDVLLTNFHLPRSSLLALLEAFMGPGWRDLYDVALEAGYRFLSLGDAMIVARAAGGIPGTTRLLRPGTADGS